MMDKNKNEIISELYATRFVENYTRKIASGIDLAIFQDIIGEIYLKICELPEKVITEIYNGCGINCFRRYVSGLIYRQVKSSNSTIYWKYKVHEMRKIVVHIETLVKTEPLWEDEKSTSR